MPSYRVAVAGFPDVCLQCSGCSGDALTLALQKEGLQGFKVQQRSKDGRQWCFEATFHSGTIEPSEKGSITRLVKVDRIAE